MKRVAQCIRRACRESGKDYKVESDFEDWKLSYIDVASKTIFNITS